jgi:hypothetical protein
MMGGSKALVRGSIIFTGGVLFRSAPHRLALAIGAAAAIAFIGAAMFWSGRQPASSPLNASLLVWMLQTLVLASLLAAFRQCIRTPAELRANWIFTVCWPEDIEGFLTGVRRAATLLIILPVILILLPVHILRLGTEAALIHALTGLALALVALTLLVTRRHLPFASAGLAAQSPATVGPIAILVTIGASALLAWAERTASSSTVISITIPFVLALTGQLVRVLDARSSAGLGGAPPADAFDTSPETLGLYN